MVVNMFFLRFPFFNNYVLLWHNKKHYSILLLCLNVVLELGWLSKPLLPRFGSSQTHLSSPSSTPTKFDLTFIHDCCLDLHWQHSFSFIILNWKHLLKPYRPSLTILSQQWPTVCHSIYNLTVQDFFDPLFLVLHCHYCTQEFYCPS